MARIGISSSSAVIENIARSSLSSGHTIAIRTTPSPSAELEAALSEPNIVESRNYASERSMMTWAPGIASAPMTA